MNKTFLIIALAGCVLVSGLAFTLGSNSGESDTAEADNSTANSKASSNKVRKRRITKRMLSAEPSPEEGKRRLIMKHVTFSEESLAPLDKRSLNILLTEMADLSDGSAMSFDINRMLRAMGLNNFLGPDDIPQALTFAGNLKDQNKKSGLTSGILKRWADFDGQAAMDYASENLKEDKFNSVTDEILTGWASSDPMGAYEWLREQQEEKGTESKSAYSGLSSPYASVFAGLASEDLDYAWNEMQGLSNKNHRIAALRGMAQMGAMEEEAQDELWSRVSGLEDESERNSGLKTLVQQTSQMDPARAAVMVESIEHDSTREELVGNVAGSWMMGDPDSAGAWLLENTSEENQGEAIKDALSTISYMNPEGAAAWLESVEDRADTQPATVMLVQRLSDSDPERAWSMIGRIEDEPARLTAMRDTYQNWNARNPNAAAAALQEANITPEQLQEAADQDSQPDSTGVLDLPVPEEAPVEP